MSYQPITVKKQFVTKPSKTHRMLGRNRRRLKLRNIEETSIWDLGT